MTQSTSGGPSVSITECRIGTPATGAEARGDGILVLDPGLYKWSTGGVIDEDVTLSGSSDDTWIFQIAGEHTVASEREFYEVSSSVR